METLKITRSNDRKYYYLEVVGSTLSACGQIARRMDGTEGLTWDGTYLPKSADKPEVEAAIRSVLETGEPCTITVGQPQPVAPATPEWTSKRGLTLAEEMDCEDSIY